MPGPTSPLTSIFNLSKHLILSGPEEELLLKGLTFIPATVPKDRGELMRDIHSFNRK